MATVRGILVKQFGGPDVLEYVTNVLQPSKPAARQVHFLFVYALLFHVLMSLQFMFITVCPFYYRAMHYSA